jgi:hypothetical protein
MSALGCRDTSCWPPRAQDQIFHPCGQELTARLGTVQP